MSSGGRSTSEWVVDSDRDRISDFPCAYAFIELVDFGSYVAVMDGVTTNIGPRIQGPNSFEPDFLFPVGLSNEQRVHAEKS